MKPWIIKKIVGFIPKIEDRIHLFSKEGHYEIVSILDKGVEITCNIWQARNNYPTKPITKFILFKDIKCKFGGFNI